MKQEFQRGYKENFFPYQDTQEAEEFTKRCYVLSSLGDFKSLLE